jgi:hypothetical protein
LNPERSTNVISAMVVFSSQLDQFRAAWDLLCKRARGPAGATLILVSPDADGLCAARIVEVGVVKDVRESVEA